MSSLGEKIKEVFTGHHQEKNNYSDATTSATHGSHPSTHTDNDGHTKLAKVGNGQDEHHSTGGATGHAPQNQPHQHHHEHHHDPEIDAKKATSAAGNYPYWGDMAKNGEEGHNHHDHQHHHHRDDDTSASGALDGESHHHHQKDSAIAGGALATSLATGAGASGAGDSSSTDDISPRHAEDTSRTIPDTTQQTNYPMHTGDANTQGTAAPVSTHGNNNDASSTRDFAAGAGGVGAGYLASRHQDPNRDVHRAGESGDALAPEYANQSGRAFPLQGHSATGSAADSVRPGTAHGGDDESRRRKEEGLLGAGAGAAGLAGAGYLASRKQDEEFRPEDRPTTTGVTSGQRESTSLGARAMNSGSGGVYNTVVGAGSGEDSQLRGSSPSAPSGHVGPRDATAVGPQTTQYATSSGQQQAGTSESKSGGHRDKEALAAVAALGAGTGAVAAEEKHRHYAHKDENNSTTTPPATQHEDKMYRDTSNRPSQTSSGPTATASQPAQLAAQQAWNRQQTPTGSERSEHVPGAGVAGAAAAYRHGQGQGTGEDVAGRGAHARGTDVMPGTYPGSGAGTDPSRVIHKCHQCGADNDISEYLGKGSVSAQ